jgi:hypothetical protein
MPAWRTRGHPPTCDFFRPVLVAVATTAQTRDFKPADVTVCVKGDITALSSVDQGARATVTYGFAPCVPRDSI